MMFARPSSARVRTLGLTLRALQVRLRFIVILAISFLVASQWDTLRNRVDAALRSWRGLPSRAQAVSPDTEYFCPMDPGVVSEWPGKCGICNMGLVRRKMGDSAPLPSGVVARMQFSPYRVQLAGIRTTQVSYDSPTLDVTLNGIVAEDGSRHTIDADLFERERRLVVAGSSVEIIGLDGVDRRKVSGRVEHVESSHARVVFDDPDRVLHHGQSVAVRVRRPVAELEPFRSLPEGAPALKKGDAVAVYLCPEHPEVLAQSKGKCPIDQANELVRKPLLENQRLGWWCPMHPKVVADKAGGSCAECGGMKLVPRVVSYRPQGKVLTVPESAVVDTGTRSVVYLERMAGMFDGVEVVLGPRCGDWYPVVKGLEPGDTVASAGAFLIDAETRLNPSLATGYFGATRNDRKSDANHSPENELSTDDQRLVAMQKICPVTRKRLGSMGAPIAVEVMGKRVFICCDGCEDALKKTPEKYLPNVP